MQEKTYAMEFEVPSPSNVVYTAINNVSGWWTQNITGNSKKIGDVFTVTFGETFIQLKVTELRTNFKVVWEVVDCHKHFLKDKKEWVGTKIHFDIENVDYENTKLKFVHKGLVSALECYEICCDAWGRYLHGSLKKLITTGKGTPDQKEEQLT